LLCPPNLLTFDAPVQGQLLITTPSGTVHFLDVVGSRKFYPNVADFIEEVRRMGVSRRAGPNTPLDLITPESRLLTAHAHAWLYNIDQYGIPYWTCPRDVPGHGFTDPQGPVPMCGGVWWWDVEQGEPVPIPADVADHYDPVASRLVRRIMPSFTYIAHERPDGITPDYGMAVFAAWPIARIAVIRGEHGEHENAVEKLTALQDRLQVPWEVVDQ